MTLATRRATLAALVPALVTLMVLVAATPAAAQFSETERTLWGISASLVPQWTTIDGVKTFHRADVVDLSGSTFHVGVARGTWLGGDSGWSFFRQSIKDGSSLMRDDYKYVTVGRTTLSGVQYHRFAPFTTIRERIQVGVFFGAGFGWYRGMVDREDKSVPAGKVSMVPAGELSMLARPNVDNRWVPAPMLKVAGAATALVGPGVKGRVTFGYGLLTGPELGFGLVYLVGGG